MSEAVVADSTVLIFLGKLRRLDWLRDAYDEVLIPTEIHEEVVVQGRDLGATDAALVDEAIDEGWIDVVESQRVHVVDRFDLEAGETAALSLALDRDHDEILLDEESAREVARLLDLEPRGTLSFLFGAVRDGQLSFEGFLEQLETLTAEGFYLDESVSLEAVRTARRLADE